MYVNWLRVYAQDQEPQVNETLTNLNENRTKVWKISFKCLKKIGSFFSSLKGKGQPCESTVDCTSRTITCSAWAGCALSRASKREILEDHGQPLLYHVWSSILQIDRMLKWAVRYMLTDWLSRTHGRPWCLYRHSCSFEGSSWCLLQTLLTVILL